MPIRVEILSTHYSQLGEHMGFRQVRKSFDPAHVVWRERLVVKESDRLPLAFRAVRRATRDCFSRAPRQYMLEDYLAERSLLRLSRRDPPDVVQYLDGEHSYRHLARWLGGTKHRPRCAAMFHMPPDVQDALIDREEVRRLDAVVAIAPDQAEWFRSWLEPSRVHLVLHGIDEVFFHPAGPEAPASVPPWKIITVGSNFRDYGVVFDVARRLAHRRDLEFHVVKRFPAGTDIPANTRVHTGLSDGELAALYRQCHACLLPVTKATANNTLLEAMASGLPCVASDLPAIRAYTRPEAVRLFAVGDAEGAAEAVRALVDEPAQRAAMGLAARKHVLGQTWRHSAEGLAGVYASLLRS
jgi:glycosyltransferase involved in cell wall biosynthesis